MLNLDTHILLHALSGTLRPREKKLLGSQPWSISAIVLWEVCKLAELGRVDIDVDDAEVTRTFQRIYTWPLTWEVARQSCQLDVRADPADQIKGFQKKVRIGDGDQKRRPECQHDLQSSVSLLQYA